MIVKLFSLSLVLLGLTVGVSCLPPAQAQAGTGYELGASDVVSIQVINFPELAVPQVTVPPDGKITVPLLGSLSVTGKTTTQVAAILTRKWSDYVVAPSVTVTLTQERKQTVQIYGHVAHAGTIEYKSELHLITAMAEVGGIAEDGDPTQVTVTHKDGAKQSADLSSPETKGGTDQDLLLAADDVVYVPQRHTEVSVLGEVVKPGSYDFQDKMTVLDALKDADNVNPDTADLPNAMLLHNGQDIPLDLDALLHGGKLQYNLMLAAGDRLFVPTIHNKIYVDGAVLRPGIYAYKTGDRIVDAINGCGGTQANVSDLAKVTIVHMDKLHDTATKQDVDVAKFYRTADMRSNPVLVPGDAVYVPIKGERKDPIAVLGNLIGIGINTRTITRP